jgi:hypothetical protein
MITVWSTSTLARDSAGTPQVAGPGVPLTQHIGPQPNLPKAMALV